MGNTANHGLDGVVNVRAFGAIGDGVTDDRASIQQTIHAVSVAGGGVAYLPPGSWLLGGSLTIESGVTLRGAGAVTVLHTNVLAPAVVSGVFPTSDVVVEDLRILGPISDTVTVPTHTRATSGAGVTVGIQVVGDLDTVSAVPCQVTNVTVRRVTVDRTSGLAVRITGVRGQVVVADCKISDCEGVSFEYNNETVFTGNTIRNGSGTAIAFGRGSGKVTCATNTVDNAAYHGISLSGFGGTAGPEDFVCGPNTIHGVGSAGIILQDAPTYGTISGNAIDKMYYRGAVDAPTDVLCSGIMIKGTAASASTPTIYATGLRVSGNTIRRAPRAGIYLNATKSVAVAGNLITDCGTQYLADGVTAVASTDTTQNIGILIDYPNTCANTTISGNDITDQRTTPYSNWGIYPTTPTITVDSNRDRGCRNITVPPPTGSTVAGFPGLAAWRAAMGRRRGSVVNVVSIGSSSVYGSGATVLTDRFVDRVAQLLAANDMVTTGRHSLAAEGTAGGWTGSGTITTDACGLGLVTKRLATAATLSRTDACTGWDIHFAQGPGAGAFTVTIDGGTPTTVTPDTSGTAERHDGTYSTAVLASANHSLVIIASAAVAISGVYICAGDNTAGIRSFCSGKGGTTASTWATADQSLFQRIYSLRPGLVQVLVGPNDYATSVDPVAFSASINTFLGKLRASCSLPPSVLLIGTFRRLDTGFTPAYAWTDYTTALATIAAANPTWCAFLDLSPDFPTSKQENVPLALVSTSDFLHQTTTGHQVTADRIVGGALTSPAPAVVVRESFGPNQVPGLLVDFNPQDLVGTVVDGGSVASFTPTWGVERAPLVQATSAQQPTIVYGAINGLAALNFDAASTQTLDTGLWAAGRGTATVGKSVLVVVRPSGTLASGQTVYTGTSAASMYAKMQYTSSTVASFACGGDADTAIQYTTAVNAWHGQIANYNGAASTISRLPGTASDRSGTTGTGATAGLAGLRLGGNIAGTGGYITMRLARICVWDQALTEDQISQLLEWVSSTYGA